MNVWNSKIKQSMQTNFQNNERRFNENIPILEKSADNVILAIPGAEVTHNNARNNIENSVLNMKRATKNTRDSIKQIDHNSIIRKINKTKQQLQAEKDSLKNKQIVVNVRKEQTNALQTKEIANYHSSWLGLWRPLSETGRITLFILSIVFGILFIIFVAYFLNTNMKGGGQSSIPTNTSSNSSNVFNSIGGGIFFKHSSK